jgi:UDP-2,3-diacylglucosamine pyrophosphatase LpxH
MAVPVERRKTTKKQADGTTEVAEDRAAEIAEHVAECAREMKLKACDTTWGDFREYAGIAWGQNRLGIVRRDITRLGGFNAIRDAYFPKLPTDHGVTRLRLREHANLNRRLGRDVTEQAFVLDEMKRLTSKLFKGRITPIKARQASDHKISRAIVAVLSDLHFGSDLHAEETGFLDYGRVEEARRLAKVVKQIAEYKAEYRDSTELHLVLAGDLIHGKLHDQQDGAPRAEQKMRAIHLLSQAVAHLAAKFKIVKVHCVSGNHDRDLTRHHGRATVGKWDGSGTEIYSSIRLVCERLTNVSFSIPLKPFEVFEIFGKKYFVTHGDTVLSAGNPGKSVETGRLEAQINRWSMSVKEKEKYSVFIMGHVHTPMVHHMANNAWLVINGCLIPADNYCVSLGLPETVSDQVMFEATPGYPVGDFRFITLDKNTDEDVSLDRIVKPWTKF